MTNFFDKHFVMKGLVKSRDHEVFEQLRLLPAKPKPQTEDLYLKKIHKMNAMPHQMLEAGGLAKGQPGPCLQGVLHPTGAV